MKLVLLALVAAYAAADIELCRTDLGNGAQWLGVDIVGGVVQEIAHQNHPQGENFCFTELGQPGDYVVSFYSELQCTFNTEPNPGPSNTRVKRQAPLPGQQVSCGGADADVGTCEDNQLRAIVRVAASLSTSADELAQTLRLFIRPRDFFIYVAKIEGEFTIDTNIYTDQNVCLLTADDADVTDDIKFVIITGKLGTPEGEGPLFRGVASKQRSHPMHQLRQERQKKSVQEEGPLGSRCAYDVEEFPDMWYSVIATGVEQAATVGDAIIGENFCIDSRRDSERFDLAVFARTDLDCDDAPTDPGDEGPVLSARRRKSHVRRVHTTRRENAHKQAKKLQGEEEEEGQYECMFDTSASSCGDELMRDLIRKELFENQDGNVYEFAKLVQEKAERVSTRWSVTVLRMDDDIDYELTRTYPTDLNFCTVEGFNSGGAYMVVQATKLDF